MLLSCASRNCKAHEFTVCISLASSEVAIVSPVSLKHVSINFTEERIRSVVLAHAHSFEFVLLEVFLSESVNSVLLAVFVQEDLFTIEGNDIKSTIEFPVSISLLRNNEVKILAALFLVHNEHIDRLATDDFDRVNKTL
jgi:hypothetical protein